MGSTQQVLANKKLDEQLLRGGYVVVPFLTTDEVAELVNFYYQSHQKQLEGMYATAHVPDLDLRMSMNTVIKKVFQRAIGETFTNCNPLGGSFIAKGKGSKGTLHPHQDWNIVDEEQYRSFNIWVPLVDVNDQNGTIKVLPESHLWLNNYRSANIHSAYGSVNNLLWQKMISLNMKAGEALIYDHRMLHASGENNTDEIRLTAVYGIIPQGAQMYYYHKADEQTVEVFESNPEFFLYGNIFEGPKGLKSVRRIPFRFPEVNEDQLYTLMGEKKPASSIATHSPQPKSFFTKLKELF